MTPEIWFDEQDIKGRAFPLKRVPAHDVIRKDVLFFHYRSDKLDIDEPATPRHKVDYKIQYEAFLKSKESKEEVVTEMVDAGVSIDPPEENLETRHE